MDRLIVGQSPAVVHLRALIARVAPTTLPVLVQGPTGAGKELVAQALHEESGRLGGFVPFNVSAITDAMFEDALFGHVRGAFTGAANAVAGYLAEANGGTLLLDEIGTLSMHSQAKLLRALDTGQYRPLGGSHDRQSDFRLVAATNEQVSSLVSSGRFRLDLAHRIAAIVIPVPPLRERSGDIPLLVDHFLQKDVRGDGSCVAFAPSAYEVLQSHHWPGNIRELRHVVRGAIALATEPVVTGAAIRALLEGEMCGGPVHEQHAARSRLLEVLEGCGWDTAVAAIQLNVHRATIYRQMERLGITPRTRLSRPGVLHGFRGAEERAT